MTDRRFPDAWLQTYTGRQLWPLEPDPADVCIEDIAHALSMLCRYGGHSNRFYSVAEHAILVASKTGIHGLLHDAAEAYVVDLPRPLKLMLPDYSAIEDRVLEAIYLALLGGPPPRYGTELHRRIKQADTAVLATEKLALHKSTHPWQLAEEPYSDMRIYCYPPEQAELLFWVTWDDLRAEAST